MRSPKSAVFQLLDATAVPVYLLDARNVVVFANRFLGTWQGIEPGELLGQRCEYHSEAPGSSAAAIANRLCPPPDLAMEDGPRLRIASIADADQECTIQFWRLADDAGQHVGTLAIGHTWEDPAGSDWRLEARRLHEALGQQRQQLPGFGNADVVLGVSPQAKRLQRQVALAAKTAANVLIVGPSGSGRERCGRAIHALAEAKDVNPLIPLDCALLDAELLQSTVASFLQSCAELESPGIPVLLLLEVDRLEDPAQQELGELLSIDELALRVVATSQSPLTELARAGRYRIELAELLGALVMSMPALADRREDIPILAQALIERKNPMADQPLAGLTPAALEMLIAYDWPRGYAELVATMDAAIASAEGPLLDVRDLPSRLQEHARPEAVRRPVPVRRSLDQYLAAAEKSQLKKALRQARGNKAKAARILGIARARLLRRLEYFDLKVDGNPDAKPPQG